MRAHISRFVFVEVGSKFYFSKMTSFKVISVCFVVCAFVATCSAAPRRSEDEMLPVEVQESLKKLTHDLEYSYKGFAKNFEFMFKSLNAVFRTTLETGFVNVATWAMDIIGRFEILVMADGSHFMTPLNSKSELEKEYKTVCIAVAKLLRNLKTMEWADKLITNATRKVVSEDMEKQVGEMKSSPEKAIKTILHSYIETLDHLFEGHHELATEYKKQKTEAQKEVAKNPKMDGPLFKLWEENHDSHKYPSESEIIAFLKDKETVRRAYVNKLFMKHAVKNFAMIFNSTRYHRFTVARAMILKGHSSGFDSKVNHVYHQALTKAGGVEYIYKHDDVISDVLFETIEKSLEAERSLHQEIQTLMNQIEGSTIYDFDMLHIDFAPL